MNRKNQRRKMGCLVFGVLLLAIVPTLQGQHITITGNVFDIDTDTPLPGVNIMVKGTTTGTSSGADGSFELGVPSSQDTLIFSFVGYQSREIPIEGRSKLDVGLEPEAISGEEMVIVGYGSQREINLTGSVSEVEVTQMESQPNTNIAQALRGRVAGVQFTDNGRPGQSGEILIRGQRSISASNDPLIILDGAFFNGELADINPNNVASTEVLKDASAAAIYGSRAANGVILITSKRGTTQKPQIRLNISYGTSDWSHKIPLFGPREYIQRRLDYREQNGLAEIPAEEILNNPEREMYNAGQTIDPWEYISQNANQQSYNLSVSGQTDRTNYFLSGSYDEEMGLIYGDRSSRLALRLNMDNDVTEWLRVGTNSMFSQRDGTGIDASLIDAYWMTPYAQTRFAEGEFENELVPYPTGDQLVQNPLFDAARMTNEEVSNNLSANIYARVEAPFVEGLSYRFNFNPNLRWDHDYSFDPIYQKHGFNNTGSGRKYNRNRWNWQFENLLMYNGEFGKHVIDVTLLYGQNHSEWEATQVDAEGFFNDANGWNNLNIAEVQTTETQAEESNGISSMARINYRFQDRYLLTLTGRRDGSSVFGEHHKFGNFYSVAGAWIVTEESFIQGIEELNMLKLRFSYGSVGNQAVSSYLSLDQAESGNYVYGEQSVTGIYPSPNNMPNSDLRWETTQSLNAAIDFSMLNDRIGGTFEYYSMRTEDLLLFRSLPSMTGFYGTTSNIGETSNEGLEISLNTINVRSGDFQWGSSLIFSTNKNRIEHLYRSDVDSDGQEDDDLGNRWFIGEPIDVTYDYVFDGIYQEGEDMPSGYQPGWVKVKDLDGDGEITTDDRTVLGQGQPKYRLGFRNDLSYKNFSLSFFINSMLGWQSEFNLIDYSAQTGNSFPGRSLNMIDAGYWTPENQSNARPSLNWTNPLGMGFYQSRDFVRLQDLTLEYNLSISATERLGLSNMRIYLSGRNLLTITDWMGPDPESGYNNINDLYPTPRTFSAGLDISF